MDSSVSSGVMKIFCYSVIPLCKLLLALLDNKEILKSPAFSSPRYK